MDLQFVDSRLICFLLFVIITVVALWWLARQQNKLLDYIMLRLDNRGRIRPEALKPVDEELPKAISEPRMFEIAAQAATYAYMKFQKGEAMEVEPELIIKETEKLAEPT